MIFDDVPVTTPTDTTGGGMPPMGAPVTDEPVAPTEPMASTMPPMGAPPAGAPMPGTTMPEPPKTEGGV